MFRLLYIKERRPELKRYLGTFVCLTSRAVHKEMTHEIDTDSLIQALRRMIAGRENVRLMQLDNDSNLLRVEKELKRTLLDMDNKK